jgi:hypothetical protein
MTTRPPVYGLLAEFAGPQELLNAAAAAFAAGYRRMDAFSPFPIEGLSEALGMRRTRLPLVVFLGGLVGAVGGYVMQWYAATVAYPLNVGGRPLNSWPAFIPVTFEMTVLVAALTAVLGMLAMNGLPRPYHPVFHIDRFAHASRDAFFLLIEARDPQFDRQRTREFLQGLNPREIVEVPH